MNHLAAAAWHALDSETQRAETRALSERFLAYLEWLAEWCDSSDRPGYHAELIEAVRRERADNARLRALAKAGERAWRNGSGPPPNVNRFADELAALLDAHGIPRYAVSVLT